MYFACIPHVSCISDTYLSRGPAPKRCKKRMCFLVNSPPAPHEAKTFQGRDHDLTSLSSSRLATIRIGRGRRTDECGLRGLLSAGVSVGAGGIAYLQQFSSSVEPAAGGRGRGKARGLALQVARPFGLRCCQYCRKTRPLARPPEGTQKKSLDAAVA